MEILSNHHHPNYKNLIAIKNEPPEIPEIIMLSDHESSADGYSNCAAAASGGGAFSGADSSIESHSSSSLILNRNFIIPSSSSSLSSSQQYQQQQQQPQQQQQQQQTSHEATRNLNNFNLKQEIISYENPLNDSTFYSGVATGIGNGHGCYENSLGNPFDNDWCGSGSGNGADINVKYEYKEPEENFISIDDLKVKPLLFELMKSKNDEFPTTNSTGKKNFEKDTKTLKEVKSENANDDDDDDVILIEDDDDEDDVYDVDEDYIDENEVGVELDWTELEEQDKQYFECFLCNKKVVSSYNLRRHMMIHTGERPFGCDICLKRFREFSDLKKHRKVHINEQGYTCLVCRKNPPSIMNATKCTACDHKDRRNRTNYGELSLNEVPCIEGSQKKAYICPVCDRIFGSRHNLKRHYMIHTGEKPYKCDICQKHFREVSTLKKHMMTHSRIKLFKCVTCGKEYSDFGAYNRHKITHNDYYNNYGDEFDYDSNSNSRITAVASAAAAGAAASGGADGGGDEEEYLFECAECYKKFSNVSFYKEHLKMHSHDFTFQCYICKRVFRTKEKLNAHFVIHDFDDSN